MCIMLKPKDWLDENEWENKPIESEAWSHYTMLDTLMEEYIKIFTPFDLFWIFCISPLLNIIPLNINLIIIN